MKRCTRCTDIQPVSEFHNDKQRRDGKYPHCKRCVKEKGRAIYEADTERRRESAGRWRRNNRAAYLEAARSYSKSRHGNRDPGKPWPEGYCTYSAAHFRVRDVRGSAAEYDCVDCGTDAAEWSYRLSSDNEFQDERTSGKHTYTVSYSPDPADYDPRCKSCHTKHDRRLPYNLT